jgi:hypothetical protein
VRAASEPRAIGSEAHAASVGLDASGKPTPPAEEARRPWDSRIWIRRSSSGAWTARRRRSSPTR